MDCAKVNDVKSKNVTVIKKTGIKLVDNVLRFHNEDVLRNGREVIYIILSLKYTRLVEGIKNTKSVNKAHNKRVAEKNEIRAMVWVDPDIKWYDRKRLLSELR